MKSLMCFIVVGAFSFQMGCAKPSDSGSGETELTKKLYTLFDGGYCHEFAGDCNRFASLKYESPLRLKVSYWICPNLPNSCGMAAEYHGVLNCSATEPLICSDSQASIKFVGSVAYLTISTSDGHAVGETLDVVVSPAQLGKIRN